MKTTTSTISYLDAKETVTVATPIFVRVGWGDRAASIADGKLPLSVWTEPDEQGVKVEVVSGVARAKRATGVHPVCDWYKCDLPLYAADVIEAYRLVNEAAQAAEQSNPAIAAACEHYRSMLADLKRDEDEHYRLWREFWAPAIAKKFRRKSVEIGEQTVPGKHCVRSSRGRLLGYANCWDGRWLGTVERL